MDFNTRNRDELLDGWSRNFVSFARSWSVGIPDGYRPVAKPLPEGNLSPPYYRFRTTGEFPSYSLLSGGLYDSVCDSYKDCRWELHDYVGKRNKDPGDRVAFLKEFPLSWPIEWKLVWGSWHGWWPATHAEGNDFCTTYPNVQRQGLIGAPGAFCIRHDARCMALFGGNAEYRNLRCEWFEHVEEPYRLLFVRNVPSAT